LDFSTSVTEKEFPKCGGELFFSTEKKLWSEKDPLPFHSLRMVANLGNTMVETVVTRGFQHYLKNDDKEGMDAF